MELTNLLLVWFTEKRDSLIVDIPKDVMFVIRSYCVGPFIGKNNDHNVDECNDAHRNAGFEDHKCAKCNKKANYFAAERYYCKYCVDGYKNYCEEADDIVMYEKRIYNERFYDDSRCLGNEKDEIKIENGLHEFINCRLCSNDHSSAMIGSCQLCHWEIDGLIKVYHWTPKQIKECFICAECNNSKNREINKIISTITIKK